MEEVKKLLVPAVSTRRGNRPNPNAACGGAARRHAAGLPVYFHTYGPSEQVAGGTLRYGEINKQVPPARATFHLRLPLAPAPSRTVPPLMSAGIFLAPPLIFPRWP